MARTMLGRGGEALAAVANIGSDALSQVRVNRMKQGHLIGCIKRLASLLCGTQKRVAFYQAKVSFALSAALKERCERGSSLLAVCLKWLLPVGYSGGGRFERSYSGKPFG
jgi:hypothetical protein